MRRSVVLVWVLLSGCATGTTVGTGGESSSPPIDYGQSQTSTYKPCTPGVNCAEDFQTPSPKTQKTKQDPAVIKVCGELGDLLDASAGGPISESLAESYVKGWNKLTFTGETNASNNLNAEVRFVYGDLYYTPKAPFDQLVSDILLIKSDCHKAGLL